MNINRKCFFVSSWPNSINAFSTFAWTWRKSGKTKKKIKLLYKSTNGIMHVSVTSAPPYLPTYRPTYMCTGDGDTHNCTLPLAGTRHYSPKDTFFFLLTCLLYISFCSDSFPHIYYWLTHCCFAASASPFLSTHLQNHFCLYFLAHSPSCHCFVLW